MNAFPTESAKDTGENATVFTAKYHSAKPQTREGSLSVCFWRRRVGVGRGQASSKGAPEEGRNRAFLLCLPNRVVKETPP